MASRWRINDAESFEASPVTVFWTVSPRISGVLVNSMSSVWLEGEFAPPTYTPEQLDELDQLTEAWVKDHERQAEAAKTQPRTRHS